MLFSSKKQNIESTTNQKSWSKKTIFKALLVTSIAGSGLYSGIVNAKSNFVDFNDLGKSKVTNETTLVSSANNTDFYIEQGNSFLNSQQYHQAVTSYTQAIKINPQSANAYYNRANTYYFLQEYETAIADYTQALRINSQDADIYNNRGNTYSILQQYKSAIADFSQAIVINPQYVDAYYNRGNLYNKLQQYGSALSDYTQAISIDPQYVEAYYNRGNLYLNSQQYEKAISDFTKAIGINSQYAQAYNNRGITYVQIGQYQKAIADLEIAEQLHAEQNNTADSQQARGVIQMIKEEIARLNTPAPTTTYYPSTSTVESQVNAQMREWCRKTSAYITANSSPGVITYCNY